MQSLWLVGTWLQMPPFYLKLEFLSQIAVRFDVGTIGKWIIGTISRWEKVLSLMLMLGEIPLMFILGVLNTSHVDLIIGEDASPIGWALPPNVSLWSEAGVLFRKSALKLKLLKKEAKNYVSCWSYWRGRVSNFWCTLSDWLGCLSKFLTLIWSFICRSIFKSLWSGVFLPLSFLITFSGV